MKQIFFFFSKKQTSVRSAATVLISMVLVSRVLGLVRDRLLAARFDPEVLGVYFAAFRIPNLVFELLVMGTLTAAFIPVFTKYVTEDKKDDAWRISSTLIHVCTILFALFSLPLLFYTDAVCRLIAPGFTNPQIIQMSEFTRFMIVFQVFPLLIGNFFTGILQSYNLFFAPAAAPVIYNFGIIIAIITLTPLLGIWAPVVGVGIGAVLFICIQIPSLVAVGYTHKPVIDLTHSGVREVGKLMVPRTVGLAVSQIDTTVDLVLSTLLGARMVTIFQFAQHLQMLPVGLFGTSVAQAAFPILSQASARDDKELFKKTLISGINQMLFFIMPLSVFFIVFRIPIVRLVFGASRFDWAATVLTGMTLSAFSISLFAQSMSPLLTRAFFALYDSATPVLIGVVTITLNAALSIFFVFYLKYPVWSLGLSTSISSILNTILLYLLLSRKLQTVSIRDIGLSPVKMTIAALIMGVALYIPLKLFDQLIFDTTRISGLILLTGVSGFIGISCYLFFVWVFGVSELQSFLTLLDKVRRPKQVVLEPAQEVVNNGGQDSTA
jgi:putative peptidoglycan lipid II flippase